MKKTVTSLVSLGFIGALAFGLVNCRGTGGDPSFGNNFVNQSCNPDSSCLEVSTPNGATIVGDEASFGASLRNGDGSSAPGVEICCFCPNGGCGVIDPSGGCGFTDSGGRLSGRFSCDQVGSHQFECEAPAGFGLEVRNTIKCQEEPCDPAIPGGEPGSVCGSNQFCAEGGGACGFPDQTCVAKSGGCCESDDHCLGDAKCIDTICRTCQGASETCSQNTDCCSNNCNTEIGECIGG